MKNLFVCYSRCTTCQKAKKWLDDHGVDYEIRDIKTQPPTEGELRRWVKASGLPLKRFFNTSGQLYRSLGLSKKLPHMCEDDMFAVLATDGMLVKRPVLLTDDAVLVGFRAEEWKQIVQNK